MEYNVDPGRISLSAYLRILKRDSLLPGRRMLLEDIQERFQRMADAGVDNLSTLKRRFATPEKLSAFAVQTGIPNEYLTLLKRQMGSLVIKSVPLPDFPGMAGETVEKLASAGLRSSSDFLKRCGNLGEAACAGMYELDDALVQELNGLCELVQINGVGPAAARAIYDAGYRSVRDVAHALAPEMLRRVSLANEAAGYYRASLGERDMQFVIDSAALLVQLSEGNV